MLSIWECIGIGVGLLNIVLSAIIIARLRVPIQLTVPQSEISAELRETLRQVNAKLTPTITPLMAAQLEHLVLQGVELADKNQELHGPDRFRVARDYVIQQAAIRHLTVDDRALALSIEAVVATRNASLTSQPKVG